MARGTRPKNAPPPPNQGNDAPLRRAIRYTQVEALEQLAYVEQSILQGVSPAAIFRGAKERFGINAGRVTTLRARAFERINRDSLERTQHAKQVALARSEREITRLEGMIVEAREQKDWKRELSVRREHRHERDHLAMIHGLSQVNVQNNTINVSVGQALGDVMRDLTGERAAELVARARERERLASAYEREVLGVVDVGKLPPHTNGTAE